MAYLAMRLQDWQYIAIKGGRGALRLGPCRCRSRIAGYERSGSAHGGDQQ